MVTPAAPDSPRALPPAPTVIPVAVSSAQTSASPLDTVPLDALPSDIPNVQLHLDPGSINPVTAPLPFALANNALNLDTIERPLTYATALKGPNRLHWLNAEAEEFDRLFSTNTIKAIHAHEQPVDRRRDTTYYNPQTKEKPNRSGDTVYRIRGTIGGDRINYPGATTALTAAMPVVKLLLQAAVSEDAHIMTMDAKDYYLNTPLLRPEYLRIPIKFISQQVIDKHNLGVYVRNDSILFSVHKGMYGLPQAGLLAQQQLITHLRRHGYHETATPCLFRHNSNGNAFALVVDDFLLKYVTREAAEHLHNALSELYEM